jgi:hypothetical protein
MTMIYCSNFFEKSKYPRFYRTAVELMGKANHCAFRDKLDLEIFVSLLKRAIDESKPKDHRARVEVTYSRELEGQIAIESGKVDFQIARIYFSPVRSVLEYDTDARDFFKIGLYSQEGNPL